MALYIVRRTFTAIVEAADSEEAAQARFRLSDWEPENDVRPVVYAHDIPRDWRDYPPIDVKGRDHGTEPLSKIVTFRHERD